MFILSWERPLYLWVCLDSLRRHTQAPCRFVLIDNASTDPLVHEVIRGFERRGMFLAVHRRRDNSPEAWMETIDLYKGDLGEQLAVVEGDVMVLPSEPCWLQQFMDIATADPKMAMLGSLVDTRDFVDPEWAAENFPELNPEQLEFLIKGKSPERRMRSSYVEKLIDPFNPPGRLLFLKTEFLYKVGMLPDRRQYEACKKLGYHAGIVTGVKHRHLSFQNIFDYPDTDIAQRNTFFKAAAGSPQQ